MSGSLKLKDKGLKGDLQITFAAQYAIDFFYWEMRLNNTKMKKFLHNWLRNNINEYIIVNKLKWSKDGAHFYIDANCELPNTILSISPYNYTSLSRVFNSIYPTQISVLILDELFYFPYYNRVEIDLDLPDFYDPDDQIDSTNTNRFKWSYKYEIPPGPFSESQKQEFAQQFESIVIELNKKQKLVAMS